MSFEIEEKNGNIEVILNNEGKQAKATCFFTNTPIYNDKKIATIGDFEAEDIDIGIRVLKKCEEIIKDKNLEYIVAPMNGNTWKKYRTVTYSSDEPKFVLENVNPIEYNEMLEKAGFEKKYTYTSTKGRIDDYVESRLANRIEEKAMKHGVTIRSFNKTDFVNDFKKIYSVIVPSFKRNPLYTPISQEDFIDQYTQYIEMFDEELILISEVENKAVGFLFAIPNYDKKSIVVKTGAVLPEYEKIALGSLMLSKLQQKAKVKGYKEWIFAFMYQKNTSQKSAQRHKTKLIREYALYGKKI